MMMKHTHSQIHTPNNISEWLCTWMWLTQWVLRGVGVANKKKKKKTKENNIMSTH